MQSLNQFKRNLLKLYGLSPVAAWPAFLHAKEENRLRIAFGSCVHQDKPQLIWDAVLDNQPDLFIFLGDNIYGDSDDPDVLAYKYRKLASNEGFQKLRANTNILAIWDDHDYGRNDAGREYPVKEASRQLMLSFWEEPEGSERWTRPDGIYTSSIFEKDGKRVQVILPDLRWNRSPVDTVKTADELMSRESANMGPYNRVDDPKAELLGNAQWQWLEAVFREPADIRIFGSSIQLLPEFSGWEAWCNFPVERQRFLELLSRHQEVPTIIISGDVHWCEISRYWPDTLDQPAIEITSSGLTETWEQISPNRHRISEAYAVQNFGLIDLEWHEEGMKLNLSARDINNNPLVELTLPDSFFR
ncbi:MAG: alkaline phosphatase D family protein [Pseudohongiellaceae bacterium]